MSSFVSVRPSVGEKDISFTLKVSISNQNVNALLQMLFVFTDNAAVIVNPKGDMKGSGITGPVAKECSDLWPKISGNAGSIC